jgi:ribonuclease VapC
MMTEPLILDTSALVAVFREEDDADIYWRRIQSGSQLLMPSSVYLEAVMVLRRAKGSRAWLDAAIETLKIAIPCLDGMQVRLAADAFEQYGRGSGHVARLNFGDCLVYAAAKALDAPLLFKGDDFRHTDVLAAV